MKRRRKFSAVGLNTDLMLDTAIASLIVQKAPQLLNKFLFSSNPVTGQTATLVGVGASYLYGMLMKNNNVANIGIALGAVEFITPFVDQIVNQVTDSVMINAPKSVSTLPVYNKTAPLTQGYFRISDYGTLSDYVNNPGVRLPQTVYKDSY